MHQLQKSENFYSKFESVEGFFPYNTNSSKCTSRHVHCCFGSQDDFFRESPQRFCSGSKVLTQVEFFSDKIISNYFSGQVNFSFNMWPISLNKKSGNMCWNPNLNSDQNLYLWTHRRKFHDPAQSFSTKFRTFFIQTSKKIVRLHFLPKNHSNCSSAQRVCSFVNQAEILLNFWRFFRKFLKQSWWKKSCLEKKHPEKFLRMQFSQSPRKFSEKIWNLPDQTRTPRLQIRNPVDIFSV